MANAHTFIIKWPVDGSKREIRVEPKYYEYLLKYLPTDFLNLFTAYEVVNNPNRIFSGLKRLYSDSSRKLCIAGKPHNWYIGKNEETAAPFPQNLVYLVFLNERNSIFEFRAEEADTEDPLSPKDWKDRFAKLLWKKNL
jgi:hypothetical protein